MKVSFSEQDFSNKGKAKVNQELTSINNLYWSDITSIIKENLRSEWWLWTSTSKIWSIYALCLFETNEQVLLFSQSSLQQVFVSSFQWFSHFRYLINGLFHILNESYFLIVYKNFIKNTLPKIVNYVFPSPKSSKPSLWWNKG